MVWGGGGGATMQVTIYKGLLIIINDKKKCTGLCPMVQCVVGRCRAQGALYSVLYKVHAHKRHKQGLHCTVQNSSTIRNNRNAINVNTQEMAVAFTMVCYRFNLEYIVYSKRFNDLRCLERNDQ